MQTKGVENGQTGHLPREVEDDPSVLEDGPNGHLPKGVEDGQTSHLPREVEDDPSVLEDGPNGHLPKGVEDGKLAIFRQAPKTQHIGTRLP